MANDTAQESAFERIRRTTESGGEYWSARELATILDYPRWQKFRPVLDKAMEACENSGHAASDHFTHTGKMVSLGSRAQRAIDDFHLSRYACYLVVQNADPSKKIVALGQTYFAVQTRRQEMADELAGLTDAQRRLYLRGEVTLHNRSITDTLAINIPTTLTATDYAAFHDHGYRGLYAGETARHIAARKGLKRAQHILDYMGTEELADNLFRQVQAEARLQREEVTNTTEANRIHHAVGAQVPPVHHRGLGRHASRATLHPRTEHPGGAARGESARAGAPAAQSPAIALPRRARRA